MREALLLSIHPVYADRILNGTKTVELRRVRPVVHDGQDVLIYGSAPSMALIGAAVVASVTDAPPADLWESVRNCAGITRAEYDDYFEGAHRAAAIWLKDVVRFEEPIALHVMRTRWPWLQVPQSYRFVRVSFDGSSRRVRRIAPRVGASDAR